MNIYLVFYCQMFLSIVSNNKNLDIYPNLFMTNEINKIIEFLWNLCYDNSKHISSNQRQWITLSINYLYKKYNEIIYFSLAGNQFNYMYK